MKKQNNILTYIAKITYSVALVASLYACTDEDVIKNNYLEEGIPVEISMNFASPEMTNISTRGLSPSEEKQVNDLYILIFNENGTTRKAGSRLYTSTDIQNGKIILSTTSGKSRIYGIANVTSNQQENIKSQLDNVQSVAALDESIIKTSLSELDVDRNSAALVMSGAFIGKIADMPIGYCEITTAPTQTLSGTLELIRLDTSIQFNIKTAGVKVKKLEPKTWQVCKVPRQSFLIERNKENSGGTNPENYANSRIFNNQNFQTLGKSTNGNNIYTFQFYQFENFKKPKTKGEPKEAKDREKEETKTESEKNTRKYVYVEPCATYVEFTAYMELEVKGVTRIADIKITTLLGGKDNGNEVFSPSNFNTWRNKKYTYNITIYDVDDIITEVELKDEERPAIEGDVIDAQDEVRILDAHYNSFNIALTYEQVKKMSILIHTPFDEVSYKAEVNETEITQTTRPDGRRDYEWIKFKRTPNNNNTLLANYSEKNTPNPDDDFSNKRLDIFTLRDDVEKRVKEEEVGKGENNDIFYYTVFIDEYYYQKEPLTGLDWGSDKKVYWRNFVNQEDRYIMLIYTPQESIDKESSYSKSRYFFRQKSIQTYYNTKNAENKTALGMEHENETLNPRWGFTSYMPFGGPTHENGYLNCYRHLYGEGFMSDRGRILWSRYVSMQDGYSKAANDKNTFEISTDIVHALCLSRNRDKNGNGIIDNDEMNWYVPTYKQISGMYLGATSLPSPLFNPSAHNDVESGNIDYHFMTSDEDKIWAEEGCSNQGKKPALGNRYANQIRCVRNLGIEGNGNNTGVPEKSYSANKEDGHWVFDMSKMDESNLRPSKVTTKLGFHPNFTDTKNKPYKKFELAANFYFDAAFFSGRNVWDIYNNGGKDRCEDYAEASTMRGKGAWRTPNQREMLIIYNTVGASEMRTSGYGMYSRTYWEYSKAGAYRIFTFRVAEDANMFLDNPVSTQNSILRCVRDIN